MKIKHLQLTWLRSFEQAEFEFNSGMNLLVGVNGVGKTTVLDALRICLSKIFPKITNSQSRPIGFTEDDIRITSPALTVQVSFEISRGNFEFLTHKQRESSIPYKAGQVREQTINTPDKETYTPDLATLREKIKTVKKQPLGIFFSTRRSLISDAAPSLSRTVNSQATAFAESLRSRELQIPELAYWMKVQEVLASESKIAKKHLEVLHRAAKSFLPECKKLRAETSPKPRLLIDKGRLTFDVRQLSDGERGLLALVLDLARRLSQANSHLSDPIKQGEAIVLIDELDLHLHPKWQRTIIEQLTRTFPKCQFIATTHSPQIVAAVEPEHVLLITNLGIVRPDRTYGMDTNWILRHLMDADDRPSGAILAIHNIEKEINKGNFKKARIEITKAKEKGFDLPEWSILEARMARMEVLAR
jgi:predicted ATP-binding protein involved in virulence